MHTTDPHGEVLFFALAVLWLLTTVLVAVFVLLSLVGALP